MNVRNKNRGGEASSKHTLWRTGPPDWRRWWTVVRVSVSRGVGLLGLGCLFAGCRAGTPTDWTMQRMAMSEAWYEHAQSHSGQDANYQEGWRSGFAEGRASFSQAWMERDPAQFEAFIWEKREQAQASWRQGYDAGFSAAREQKSKHGSHAKLFGMPGLDESGQSGDPGTNALATGPANAPSLSPPAATPVPAPADPARAPAAAVGVVESFAFEPVPSQTWGPGTLPAADAPRLAVPVAEFPAEAEVSLQDAIRRSVEVPAAEDASRLEATGGSGPAASEATPNSEVTPPLELVLDDDDVARHVIPHFASPNLSARAFAAPRAGGPQLGQTISNPYFTGDSPSSATERSAEKGNASLAAGDVTTAFPRTSHREFQSNRPIESVATLPPAVLVQHTTSAAERTNVTALPSSDGNAQTTRPGVGGARPKQEAAVQVEAMPRRLPLRPRR